MTIQEAQEYSREHGLIQRDDGDDIMLARARYDAIVVIEDALDNGYQLCRVDEVIENLTLMINCIYFLGNSDGFKISLNDIKEIIEEACK